MTYFYDQLDKHLKSRDPVIDWKELHFLSRIANSQFHYWKKWYPGCPSNEGRLPTDKELEKLAAVKELGLSVNKLKAWRLVDEYGKDVVLALFEEYTDADIVRGPQIRAFLQELEEKKA